jgi:hypothetical protein
MENINSGNLKNKGVNTWGVPSFDEQDSEYEVRKQDATPF